MTKVNSHTEWGTLKEVILGRAEYAQVPCIKKHDIHCVDYANYDNTTDLPGGYYPEDIIEETIEDLNLFEKQLSDAGVVVHRPDIFDYKTQHSNPFWSTDAYYGYCPRDSTLIIGDTIIETPMPLRSRYFETIPLKSIFKNYFINGSRWISAPKPALLDDLYDRTNLKKPTLTEFEPAFDAANIIRCGKDIFYLISNSGNRIGAQWLKSILGEKYNLHVMDNIYAYVHVDTTIMPLGPGKVLLNPSRVNENNLPKYFKNWNKIWAEEMVPTSYVEHWAPASPWLGMNVLSINENLIAVESKQTNLISQLEKFGFDIIPVRMRHARTLSGGPHCVTLDTVRDDSFDDYS